jgi:hypothetical protein
MQPTWLVAYAKIVETTQPDEISLTANDAHPCHVSQRLASRLVV